MKNCLLLIYLSGVKTSKAIENRNKVLENKKSIFDTLTTSKAIENMSKSLKKKKLYKTV